MTEQRTLDYLDRLVAERVMEWQPFGNGFYDPAADCEPRWEHWNPTRDLNQCVEMDAVMRESGGWIEIHYDPTSEWHEVWQAEYEMRPGKSVGMAHARTLPIAWVRAALLAVGVTEDETQPPSGEEVSGE